MDYATTALLFSLIVDLILIIALFFFPPYSKKEKEDKSIYELYLEGQLASNRSLIKEQKSHFNAAIKMIEEKAFALKTDKIINNKDSFTKDDIAELYDFFMFIHKIKKDLKVAHGN